MRFINFPLETCARFTVYSFPLPRIRWKHVLFLFIAFMIFVLMFNKETVENEIVTYFDGDILDNETKILNIVLEMDNTRSTVADEFSTYTPIYNTGSLHLEYCPEKPSGLRKFLCYKNLCSSISFSMYSILSLLTLSLFYEKLYKKFSMLG